VLMGAVGLFAVAMGVGQLRDPLKLIALLFVPYAREMILLDWITVLAVTGPLILFGIGAVLLIKPPVWIMRRLCASGPVVRQLRGVVGVFLMVLAVEQVLGFSLIAGRTIQVSFHSIPSAKRTLLALTPLVVPIGLGVLGVLLLRKKEVHATHDGSTLEAEKGEVKHTALVDLWSISTVPLGAVILALTTPRLLDLVAWLELNLSGARADSAWIRATMWSTIVACALQVGMAVYLLFGAPRIAQWHVSKLDPEAKQPIGE